MTDPVRLMVPVYVFDVQDERGPFFSPGRRRILDPAERQRILPYLMEAPLAVAPGAPQVDVLNPARGAIVPSGYRTDGTRVWPDAVPYYLATYGIAPEHTLLPAIERAGYQRPEQVPAEKLAAAAGLLQLQPPARPASPQRDLRYFVSRPAGGGEPAGLLRRWTQPAAPRDDPSDLVRRLDPNPADQQWQPAETMGRDLRWHATGALRKPPGELVELSWRQAAELIDAWWAAGQSRPVPAFPERLAVTPVFDAVDENGNPYFSPDRRRIPPGAERDRLLAYLDAAPLAMRAHGFEPDPLDPSRGGVVPVGYATDGVWVWQEAAAYYLRTYGVAPEEDLVAHIERAGYAAPRQLPADVLNAAADAALYPGADPPGGLKAARYYSILRSSGRVSGLYRQWLSPEGYVVDEVSQRDLRWHGTNTFARASFVGGEDDFVELSRREAARNLDGYLTTLTQERAQS
jgi:hypothetical protein